MVSGLYKLLLKYLLVAKGKEPPTVSMMILEP
jgi:hypothetical protein